MATFYSSFFSSGLLAPQPQTPGSQTPRPPSPTTPRPSLASLTIDDTTPTGASPTAGVQAANESQVLPSISLPTSDDNRPRLRRRRSSLAGAASPLAAVKSSGPVRQAAASVQRSLRARAGSDASVMSSASASSVSTYGAAGNDNPPAPRPKLGIIGRLRSGSLGTALRPRRGLRRSVPSVPVLPPPTAPLPELPPIPARAASSSPSPLPTIVASPTSPATPRRPLARRSQTSNNYELMSSPFTVAGASPMCVPEDEDTFDASLRAGIPSSPALLSKGTENEMQVDYPSPVDGAAFEWSNAQN